MVINILTAVGFLQLLVGYNGQLITIVEKEPLPDNVRFVKEPKDTVVLSPVEEIKLDCLANFTSKPINYKWYKIEVVGKTPIIDGQGFTFVEDGILFNTTLENGEQSGIYQCEANATSYSILSRTARVTFAVAVPSGSLPRQPIRGFQYASIVISSDIRRFSIQDLEYKWMKGTNSTSAIPIPLDSPRIFTSHDGILYFGELQLEDAGEYTAQATFRIIEDNNTIYLGDPTKNQQTSKTVTLTVQPQAKPSEEELIIGDHFPQVFPRQPTFGQTIDLECFAFGSPLTYSWTFNGEPLKNKTRLSDNNRRMSIPDAQLDDEGNYTCTAANNSTNTSRNLLLQIKGRPIFSLALSDGEVKENAFHKLTCLSYGPAKPVITWYRNGEPIRNITDRYYADNKYFIILSPKIGRDDGIFQCAAKNAYGTIYSTAKITIAAVPPEGNHGIPTSSFIILNIILLFVPFL
ncbi:contactin-5 [Patella vulgata]|uniref:contactin-5 n=1 Tax=Patella vulgata TaxID=6465 RepID=UPI00217F3496|nr:contactin-5 [Patella vulgata]XP_050413238.1 contactin-5 [Patella vulgata]XP_050413239.1 contactin-5 [Patella vulgata]